MFKFFKSSFLKIKNALTKTRSALATRLKGLFGKPWDEATFEELEQILYEADLGSACAQDFVTHTRQILRKNPDASLSDVVQALAEHSLHILNAPSTTTPRTPLPEEPRVILIVGVNGSGKTTSIAKLTKHFQEEGKKVLLIAGDTFRAAAIDQLDIWAKRLNVDIVKAKPQADPSAVVFDGLTAAKARGADVVLIDTDD